MEVNFLTKGAPRGRRLLLLITASLALAAGVAYAAIPHSTTGVIDACYAKGGALRVIDTEAGEICKGSETALAWNAQGQPGPQGPQGPAGPTKTIIREKLVTTQQGYGYVDTVSCDPGEVATGGGYKLVSGIPIDRVPSVVGSYPEGNEIVGAVAWQVRWYFTPAGEQWVIYVVCAQA
jgi:hypothetical protein